jgi:hypothetical protein
MSLVFGLFASDIAAQVRQDRALIRPPAGTVPLHCRGGAMRALGFQQYDSTVSRVTVLFNRGSRPARQGLNPGECSWADRAMVPSDPEAFCHDVSDVFVATNYRQDSRYNPPDFYVLQSFWSRGAPYLQDIHRPNYSFTVNVKPQGPCLPVVNR